MTEAFRLHRTAALRTPKRRRTAAPVISARVDADCWAAALDLARARGLDEGWVRQQAISATDVLIVNVAGKGS